MSTTTTTTTSSGGVTTTITETTSVAAAPAEVHGTKALELHGFWVSPYMVTVAQAMLEAGIPFEYKYVSPYLGDNMKPEYKGHFAKIPLLIDPNNNNLAISESTTMLRYLSHRYPDKMKKIFPSVDDAKHWQFMMLLDHCQMNVVPYMFFLEIYAGYMPDGFCGATFDSPKRLQRAVGTVWGCYTVFLWAMFRLEENKELFPTGKYILGDEPNALDIIMFQNFRFLMDWGVSTSPATMSPALRLWNFLPRFKAHYDLMGELATSKDIQQRYEDEKPVSIAAYRDVAPSAFEKPMMGLADLVDSFVDEVEAKWPKSGAK